MTNVCTSLPQLISLNSFANWKEFYNYIYKLYLDDFFNNTVYFDNKPIKTFTDLNYDLKQESFEHITTKGSNDRLYNESRSQRILWVKAILESKICRVCKDYAIWPEKDRNKIRYVIWCKTVDFVVIIEQRDNYYQLISAYCVIYPNKRDDLEKKYNNFLRANKNQNRPSI
ncbi:MAG: hypothetical protein BWX97_00083 [Firmicutes bacterium ADurb.Bin146]|nr:MAG: hypothetical protein BWX97_00083 [Firmicutes bacterium ADurb.Bin146]